MIQYLAYAVLSLAGFFVFRVLREAQSYRASWRIGWRTALRWHVEWQRQITFIVGCLLLVVIGWAIVWVFATYGCSFLKGLAC
jgi:hypothetical protein